jgi:SagB-type dehydrogenase family enzyme
MLSGFSARERGTAAGMLAALAANGVVDVSGRAVGRFLHAATKKGVLPGGGLEKDEVMRLAMDGVYRAYPDARRLAVSRSVPERLRAFHALTRRRRSYREYLGLAVRREDFDALLLTACGVTGEVARAGHEVKLRAYPSSGALYAVEIYPLAFAVEGLEPAIYHYRAVDDVLEVVKPGIDRGRIVSAMLPVERAMVAGAAALICLTGVFPRHERKYGEGGYRMMVAEAGHVSQNLILVATALGLCARPFGGVFDALLNRELGLDEAEEQFLLAVLVGRPQGRDGP